MTTEIPQLKPITIMPIQSKFANEFAPDDVENYAIINKANWPLIEPARLRIFPTLVEADEARRDVARDTHGTIDQVEYQDLIVLKISKL